MERKERKQVACLKLKFIFAKSDRGGSSSNFSPSSGGTQPVYWLASEYIILTPSLGYSVLICQLILFCPVFIDCAVSQLTWNTILSCLEEVILGPLIFDILFTIQCGNTNYQFKYVNYSMIDFGCSYQMFLYSPTNIRSSEVRMTSMISASPHHGLGI